MIWYRFTLLSPVLAFICWYGKGETKVSLIIDILILAVMMSECFAIGYLYFAINRIINVIMFLGSAVILYSNPKQTVISLFGAVALSFVFRMLVNYGRRKEKHRGRKTLLMKTEWIRCPVCGNKTRDRMREDTVMKNYPLYCPTCKQETLIDTKDLQITVIKEPDAQTQSR